MAKIEFTKEWCMKAAELEGDSEVAAGKPGEIPAEEFFRKAFSCVKCGGPRAPTAILCDPCVEKEGLE